MSKIIIEPEKLVACLPGYEKITVGKMIHRISRKFYHKSGTELRLEQEQKQKLISWSTSEVEQFKTSIS
jgi:hypothetical protein